MKNKEYEALVEKAKAGALTPEEHEALSAEADKRVAEHYAKKGKQPWHK